MTNTRITDAEILEKRYPVLLREFSIRWGSGGLGTHTGGNGAVREFEFLKDLTVGILSERRVIAPPGICGGGPALRGRNILFKHGGKEVFIGPKAMFRVSKGDRFRIETPGGGGYGAANQ
jgi:5-oxoprolinase (ATP-hydrolysing)